ncbi:MAG: hypothetical protein IJ240_09345 [Clostridia bacterium]|nr:hypothetical protein [Clostridia bacterium]
MTERSNIVPFERSAAFWMSRARRARHNRRPAEALPMLREAYRQTGSDEVALEMAENYCDMGCWSAARRIAEDILLRRPELAGAYYVLGVASLALSDERLADDALATCLSKGGDSPYADDAQRLLSEFPWAEEKRVPRGARAEALRLQAQDAILDGDLPKARALLTRACRTGKSPAADAIYGEMLLRSGDDEGARRLLTRALRRGTQSPAGLLLLAEAWASIARTDPQRKQEAEKRALRALRAGLNACETPPELALAAEACVYAGRRNLILRRLLAELRAHPRSNDLKYILACVYANTGDYLPAGRYLISVLDQDPDDRDARAALCLVGLGLIPFDRQPAGRAAAQACARPPVTGDAAFKRLAHGLTISLGGVLTYREVCDRVLPVWQRMNGRQRRHCDRARDWLWPNAIYTCLTMEQEYAPFEPALYPVRGRAKQLSRMIRWILKGATR